MMDLMNGRETVCRGCGKMLRYHHFWYVNELVNGAHVEHNERDCILLKIQPVWLAAVAWDLSGCAEREQRALFVAVRVARGEGYIVTDEEVTPSKEQGK